MRVAKLFLPVFIAFLAKLVTASVLGDLAASLQPGEWKELVTNGFNKGDILQPPPCDPDGGSHIFEYADSGAWDPVKKRFMFYGATHGTCYAQGFIIYSESNNTWQKGPLHPASCSGQSGCFSHAYDHSTVNPATGDFFYREYGHTYVQKYGASSAQWSSLPAVPESVVRLQSNCCGALDWFPEMGGLVIAGWSQAGFFNSSTSQWSQLATGLASADYSHFMEYNPASKTVIFGGGSGGSARAFYRIDAAGKVIRMKDAPVNLEITQSLVTVDPAGGKYLVFPRSQNFFYEYDAAQDAWMQVNKTPALWVTANGGAAIEAAIPEYGVMMFVTWDFNNSKVYLYRHSAGNGTGLHPLRRAGDAGPVTISPNPFRSSVSFEVAPSVFGAKPRVQIFDVRGKSIGHNPEKLNHFLWNPKGFATGVYYLSVEGNGKKSVERLLYLK